MKIKLGYKNIISLKLITTLIFLVILYSILVAIMLPKNYNYEPGDIANENIQAPHRIIDEVITKQLKDQAAASVEEIYSFIPGVSISNRESIISLFQLLDMQTEINKDITASLNNEVNIQLLEEDYKIIIGMNINEKSRLKDYVLAINDELYNGDITQQNISEKKNAIEKYFSSLNITESQKKLGIKISQQTLKPNMILDVEATQKNVEEAKKEVSDVVYEEGQNILLKGDVLTDHKIDLLIENGIMRKNYLSDPYLLIGLLILVICFIIVFGLYIYKFHPKVFVDNIKILLIELLFLLMIVLSILFYNISPYLIPVAILTMTIALIIDSKLAIELNVMLVLLLSISLNLKFDQILIMMLSGYIGAIGVRKIKQRADVYKTGIFISCINSLVILSYSFITHNITNNIFIDILYSVINGFISGVITVGTLVFWEWSFGIVTPIKLLELSDPNQPLIKKLMTNAPGTYHHSLIVGNIAEAAAEKIGANSLLVRIGAFYHDIGKVIASGYYAENQISENNPHDYISPLKSAHIIKNHVIKGNELAKEYRIPYEIRNFINTHHGDSIIEYFYHKAKEKNENTSEEDFRYLQPKPKSKEEGILLLADSVEAAVRSLKYPDIDKIEERVNKIVNKKMEEKQLSKCDLTFSEIDIIKNTFIKTLSGVHHERIEYPQSITEE